jgi:hypothetical protein
MAYLCVDNSGEYIANDVPARDFFGEWKSWGPDVYGESCTLISVPRGTIKKLIGKEMTKEDEPIDLVSYMYHNGEL